MVARQHSEPAGVDREALVEAELARKVRDAEAVVLVATLPPGAAPRLGFDGREHPLQAFEVVGCRAGGELLVGERGDERGRIVIERFEALWVQLFDHGACPGQPGEPEVARDLAQGVAHGRVTVESAHSAVRLA